MTHRALDVAAEIRRRIPGVEIKKLHKLLYYCQAHHLAHSGEPLFGESISAWDMGPVVGRLWKAEKVGTGDPSTGLVDETALNTVGYVISRYGRLTGRDLEHLTHAEAPWQRADAHRDPGGSARIEQAWIRDYFRSDDPTDGAAENPAVVATFVAGARDRRARTAPQDTIRSIRDRAC